MSENSTVTKDTVSKEGSEFRLKLEHSRVNRPIIANVKCQKREKVIIFSSKPNVYYESRKVPGVVFKWILSILKIVCNNCDMPISYEYENNFHNQCCVVCFKNLKSDKEICFICDRMVHKACIKHDMCKNLCKSYKVRSNNPKNNNLINNTNSRRSMFYERLIRAMSDMFVNVTEKEKEDTVKKQLEDMIQKKPHLKPPPRAPVAGPKDWINQVNKKAKVNTIIEETENYQMVQEIMDEIFVDAFGITDEESAAESRKRGTIGFLFEKLKDAQVKEKPVATKGVENKRMEKEKEKTVEEVAVDGANETIASLKSALGIERERLNVEKNLTKVLKQYSKSLERKILVNKGHEELQNPNLLLSGEENSILIAMSSTLKDQQEQLSSIFNVLSNFSTDNVLKKAAEEGGRKENKDVDPL